MAFEEILPYLTIVAFFITTATLFYKLGQWNKNLENSLNTISTKLDNVSNSIDRVPEQFWSKFIDAYRMLGMVKSEGNPKRTRKDILLEKAQNRMISYEESLELKDMLEKEARKAQQAGNFLEFLVILGILIFLGLLIASLFE